MNTTEKTLAYYNENAEEFVVRRVKRIPVLYRIYRMLFLSYIKPGGKILDLGCGSGRDSKMFKENGYQVTAVDGSSELCKKASEYIGQDVICSTFQDFVPEESYDGIWACASLLHLVPEDIKLVINRLKDHLNDAGIFFVSFKYGDFSGYRKGRYFTDCTEEGLAELLKDIPGLKIEHAYNIPDDGSGLTKGNWLSAYLVKGE